jgi:hypothetical protein
MMTVEEIEMKLFLLTTKGANLQMGELAMVVRAECTEKARELAAGHAEDIRWKDRDFASCVVIHPEMGPAIILAGFVS